MKGKLVSLALVTTLGGFLFGFDTAVISGCNSFLQEQYQLTSSSLGWVVSSALLGTIFGCAVAGLFADKFGRKKALLVSAILLVISVFASILPPQHIGNLENPFWLVTNSQTSFMVLVLARIIGGIGVGFTVVCAPIYISEISPAAQRGKMVSFYQLSITLGILLAFAINWLVLTSAGDQAGVIDSKSTTIGNWIFVQEPWRGMFAAELPIALLFLILLLRIPESPRWLYINGKKAKAFNNAAKIQGADKKNHFDFETAKEDTLSNSYIKELVKPYLRKPLLIGILLPIFSHLSGIAAIMYFAPNILNEVMNDVENSFLGAILVGVVNFGFTSVAITKVEKVGRRKLLLFGVFGAFISLMGAGILFTMGSSWVIVPLLAYVACFAFSYGPVVWVIIGEIFPTKIRGIAVSLGTFALMVTGFVVTFSNPIMIENIGAGATFFIYAFLTLISYIFIRKKVPETKGMSLEELQELWQNQNKK